jgi:hypothetical protein
MGVPPRRVRFVEVGLFTQVVIPLHLSVSVLYFE